MFSAAGWMYILLAVASATLMNIAMKSLTQYSTYRVYVVATGVGLLLSVGGYLLWGQSDGGESMRFDRWMVALGVAVAVLNFAYIWIYQQGGNVALVPLIVTGLLTLTLVVVSYSYFGESISIQQYIGMAIVLVGLGVMVW